MVTAAWVGNDDNTPMNNVTGGWIPARMWKEFMKEATKGLKPQAFPKTRGMVSRKINWGTGLLTSKHTPKDAKTSLLKYWIGTEPKEHDSTATIKNLSKQQQQKYKKQQQVLDFLNIQ